MDSDKLRTIFDNYIRKFDVINSKEHDENYKWRLAAPTQFPALINPDDPNFVSNLKHIASRPVSYNLFNSGNYYPLGGLIKCAETDENAVRDWFRELFADDGGDLKVRQDKIDAFRSKANEMIDKAYAGRKDYTKYRNDQRAAMSYLFFRDPDSHYLYKWREASKFADCVGFEDSWRWGGSGFKMDVYYRMCDELVEAIRSYPPLLETTKRRYQEAPWNTTRLHGDENYHILAFDLIWGTGIDDNPHYNFGEKISISNQNTAYSEQMENSTPPPPATNNWKIRTSAKTQESAKATKVCAFSCVLMSTESGRVQKAASRRGSEIGGSHSPLPVTSGRHVTQRGWLVTGRWLEYHNTSGTFQLQPTFFLPLKIRLRRGIRQWPYARFRGLYRPFYR